MMGWGGWGRGSVARVSELFYKDSKYKNFNFEGVGEDGFGKWIFFTKNPNLCNFFRGGGGGGGWKG